MGLSKVIFEFDALSIIQAVNEGNVGGDFKHIIQNIRDLSSSFTWCLFQHLKWNGNKVAHDLAKEATQPNYSQHRRPPDPPTHTPATTSTHHCRHQPLAIRPNHHQPQQEKKKKKKGKKPTNHSQIGPQPIAKKNPQTKSTKLDHYSFDPCSDPCSMVDDQALSEHQRHQTQIDYPLHSNPTKSHHLHSNPTKK